MVGNQRETACPWMARCCGCGCEDRVHVVVVARKSRSALPCAQCGGPSSIWAGRKVKVKR
jgi:hypothetical protein